jgi:hypothetical protein
MLASSHDMIDIFDFDFSFDPSFDVCSDEGRSTFSFESRTESSLTLVTSK